ncbi:MAG: response regulator, partial [Oscillospiraceae bacterium]
MKKILAVDDSKFNLKAIVDTLSPFYNVHAVTGGIEAVDYLRLHNDISLVLLDIEMPVMNGIDTFKQIKQDENLHGIPVIFLTALSRPEMEKACLELGARDFIAKPFNGPIMLQRISAAIELNELQNSLQEQVVLKTRALESLTIQTIMSFARAVDAKDNYTKSHSENVAVLSWHIGNKLGFDNDKKHILYYSALLHDIGKIGVPDYILAKPGKLTDLEYEIIKKHTTIGGRILKDIDIMPQLSDVAMSHHERYDG